MEAAVEAKLHKIETATMDRLQEVANVDPFSAEMLRSEASRLAAAGFTLTQMLLHDQVERAYRVITGEPDDDDDVLGLTA